MVPGGLHAFVKTRPELAVPDIEFMFRGTSHHPHLWFPCVYPAFTDGYGIRPTLLHPDSRGELLLRSSDPREPPRICYNFLTAPNDLPTLRQGFKLARELAFHRALDPYRGEELSPGEKVQTDTEIDDVAAQDADHRAPSGRHLPDGNDAGRRARSRDARARRRRAARGRCLGDARYGRPPTSMPA